MLFRKLMLPFSYTLSQWEALHIYTLALLNLLNICWFGSCTWSNGFHILHISGLFGLIWFQIYFLTHVLRYWRVRQSFPIFFIWSPTYVHLRIYFYGKILYWVNKVWVMTKVQAIENYGTLLQTQYLLFQISMTISNICFSVVLIIIDTV